MKSRNDKIHDNKMNSSWKDYFSDNFVSNIFYLKKTISRQNKKRTFIYVVGTWIVFLLLSLPVFITGINWAGQKIDISLKFVVGIFLIVILCSIFIVIGLNFFVSPREYAQEAEMLITKQLKAQGNVNEVKYVIAKFEKCEKVSPEIYSKRFWKVVFGFFGLACLLVTFFLLLFW